MPAINFFSEDVDFKLKHARKTTNWIKESILKEKRILQGLNYIFCSDEYLLQMNLEYLNHKTLTDIITFDTSETPKTIEGDIFISIDRIQDNATKFERPFDEELHRVLIHGVLHLVGYGDKDPESKEKMRKKENFYLKRRN